MAAAALCGIVVGACGSSGEQGVGETTTTATTTTTAPPTTEQLRAALLTPEDMAGYAQYPDEGVTVSESGEEPGGCPGPLDAKATQRVKVGFFTEGSATQVVELISVFPAGSADAVADWVQRSATCPPHDETVAGTTYTVEPEGTMTAPEAGDTTVAQSISSTGGFVGNRVQYDVFCGDMRISVQVTQNGGPVDEPSALATLRTALERVNTGLGRQACRVPPPS